MIEAIVVGLLQAAVRKELVERKVYGKLAHLVFGEELVLLKAAAQLDLVRSRGLFGSRPWRPEKWQRS